MWEWRGLKNKNFKEADIDLSSIAKLKNDMNIYAKNKLHETTNKQNSKDCIKVSQMSNEEEKDKISDVYSYLPQENIEEIENFDEDEMYEYLLKKLDFYHLSNIDLVKSSYVSEQFKTARSLPGKFQRARRSFLKLLGYHNLIECMEAGIDDYEISLLKRGISPENYNVHLKIPYEFGGDLDFSNLSLVKTFPTHEVIHKLIDLQISSGFLVKHKKIYLPYVKDKIYNPDKKDEKQKIEDNFFE